MDSIIYAIDQRGKQRDYKSLDFQDFYWELSPALCEHIKKYGTTEMLQDILRTGKVRSMAGLQAQIPDLP